MVRKTNSYTQIWPLCLSSLGREIPRNFWACLAFIAVSRLPRLEFEWEEWSDTSTQCLRPGDTLTYLAKSKKILTSCITVQKSALINKRHSVKWLDFSHFSCFCSYYSSFYQQVYVVPEKSRCAQDATGSSARGFKELKDRVQARSQQKTHFCNFPCVGNTRQKKSNFLALH